MQTDQQAPLFGPLYKFMHAKDLPSWCEAQTIVISSAEYYRQAYYEMEVPDAFINDPREGQATWKQAGDYIAGMPFSANEAAFFDQLGGPPRGAAIGVTQNFRSKPFHMFCLATGDPAALISAFGAVKAPDGTVSPYDACVHVLDLPLLLDRVLNQGVTMVGGQPGPAMRDLFDQVAADDVVYEKTVRLSTEPRPNGHPFRKDEKFRNQREVRGVFRPRARPPERLIVHVPGLRSIIRVVDLGALTDPPR